MVLLVREQDRMWLSELLDEQWQQMVQREGRGPGQQVLAEGEEPPCPACGTAAPLVQNCCSDCGLRLA